MGSAKRRLGSVFAGCDDEERTSHAEISMIELLGKSKEELRTLCSEMGEPAYRGGQIYHALYAEKNFDFARMTNLPAALRERLGKEASITLPEVKQRFASTD